MPEPLYKPENPDLDFPASWAGGHALVIEYGDCEMIGSCQCGAFFGRMNQDRNINKFAPEWERHVMTGR